MRVYCLALILLACAVVQQPQMCSHCRHCDHNAVEFLGTSCIWDVVFFSVRLCVKSPSAVYFSASTNIDPHAACAPFRPALNWIFQQNDFVCFQHIWKRCKHHFSFSYFVSLAISYKIIPICSCGSDAHTCSHAVVAIESNLNFLMPKCIYNCIKMCFQGDAKSLAHMMDGI